MSKYTNAGPWRPGAAWIVAATLALGLGCSSSSNGGSSEGGLPESSTVGSEGQDGAGGTGPVDASTVQPETSTTVVMETCDASLVLPTDSGAAAACTACLKASCMSDLTMCTDCNCIADVECLVGNKDNATICMGALADLGAGNTGLTAVSGCLAQSCNAQCHGGDGG